MSSSKAILPNQQDVSTEKTGYVVYVDERLGYGKVVKGKRQIKWDGNVEELQSL